MTTKPIYDRLMAEFEAAGIKINWEPDEKTKEEVLRNGWADDPHHVHELHRYADDGGPHHHD